MLTQDFNSFDEPYVSEPGTSPPGPKPKQAAQPTASFQSVVEIPRGYHVVSHGLTQFLYDISELSLSQETGKKTLQEEL